MELGGSLVLARNVSTYLMVSWEASLAIHKDGQFTYNYPNDLCCSILTALHAPSSSI
jgi:hypothetical protein